MTPAAAVATTTLATRHGGLRHAALAALRRLVPAGTPCALIDFPTSANVGDSAIWLGARSLLDEAGAPVVYVCDYHSFSADHLEAALAPGGTILISGGGNLGDLWPAHQRFRELVVASFHHRRILAWLQMARGCRLLGRSRVVVTDRLHGHVLCALLGIPHVVLDDRFGKIRSLWETWTADWPSAAWAGSAADALGSARFLLARTAGHRP